VPGSSVGYMQSVRGMKLRGNSNNGFRKNLKIFLKNEFNLIRPKIGQ